MIAPYADTSQPSMPALPTSGLYTAADVGRANAVPDTRQTFYGLTSVNGVQSSQAKFGRERAMIASPNLAPSAVAAENALQARTLMTPEFQHHMLSTRIARISNLMAEAPRFKNQIDILA